MRVLALRLVLVCVLAVMAAGVFALRASRDSRGERVSVLAGRTDQGFPVRVLVDGRELRLVKMGVETRCESGDAGLATLVASGSGSRLTRVSEGPWGGGLVRRASTVVSGRVAGDAVTGTASLTVRWLRAGRVVDVCRAQARWAAGRAMPPAQATPTPRAHPGKPPAPRAKPARPAPPAPHMVVS